ncbi:MAG TPA: sulfotransferase [Rhizomicrobium sp.]|jgi:hypothetical protein|nr:sulfotransferase [Rhizomicrobium sp.]
MQKLAFVIGGAQKSGTCSLDRLFRMHRGIEMSSKKETHFFDDETRDWAAPDYAALHAFYAEENGRLRGEATPITLYWRPAHARLRAYNPEIRLIFLLRDPVQRAFSHWRMMYAIENDTMPFARAIREGRARVRDEAEIEGLHRHCSYVERGFYAAQLRQVLELFPKQNVHCEIFEEFFADRTAALERLSEFLGIAPFRRDIPDVHAYKGAEIEYPSTLTPEDARYLADLYRDDTAELENMLGRAIPAWRRD